MLKPTLEKFSEEQEDVKVIMINVDEHPDFASDFNVRSIPTLIYFEDGEIINKGGGNHSLEGLYSLTKKAE
jgi:thioredoxin 1